MSPTPYPRNLMHVGSARRLTLATSLTIPPTGDIDIVVEGNATASGWLPIPDGQAIVVTVGRGEAYESKYLVSTITAGTLSSTLTVLAADRNYDGTLPVNAPAGASVEHTISAAEMTSVTDHMRTKSAHGADGELVDTESAQVLANKSFTGPLSVGTPTANSHAATKAYVDVSGVIDYSRAYLHGASVGLSQNSWETVIFPLTNREASASNMLIDGTGAVNLPSAGVYALFGEVSLTPGSGPPPWYIQFLTSSGAIAAHSGQVPINNGTSAVLWLPAGATIKLQVYCPFAEGTLASASMSVARIGKNASVVTS